jgi:hypothetical protein
MSSPHPDEHKMLAAMREACGCPSFGGGGACYWQNPDGSPKALCAAPAGCDEESEYMTEEVKRVVSERAAAPVRPILNPEEEDESDHFKHHITHTVRTSLRVPAHIVSCHVNVLITMTMDT